MLRSHDVFIDLLTDSGTGAMSDKQWGGIMTGDESYAGARSWEHLESVVKALTGMEYILPTHQGRAAERILYTILGGPDKLFISNTHFDTTRANIEYTGSTAIDIICEEGKDNENDLPFKGNINLKKQQKEFPLYGQLAATLFILTPKNSIQIFQ